MRYLQYSAFFSYRTELLIYINQRVHVYALKIKICYCKILYWRLSLEIECGTYAKPKTPVEKQICNRVRVRVTMCDHEAVEDEFNVLIQCPQDVCSIHY